MGISACNMTCASGLNCCYLTYQTVADLEMKASVQELMAGRTLMHHCMSWRYLVDQARDTAWSWESRRWGGGGTGGTGGGGAGGDVFTAFSSSSSVTPIRLLGLARGLNLMA